MNKSESIFYRNIYINFDNKRKETKLSLKDISIALNVSESFIKNISQGKAHFNLEHLFILNYQYGWQFDELIPNENNFNEKEFKEFKDFFTQFENERSQF